MKYQKIIQSLKPISFFNIVNYYLPLFQNKIRSLLSIKNKANLRNSSSTYILLKKVFGKGFRFEDLIARFFNHHLFSYSNPDKKDAIISYLKSYYSEEINSYIEMANQVLNKEFTIFGEIVNFNRNVDWFHGFDGDYRWKLKCSEKIDIRPSQNKHNIDVKYVWELNRHQFLPYLGFAYYYTGDEKYAEAFKELILDWRRKNPPLYGINWVSGLEISIRLISWIFSLYFFRESKQINNSDFFPKMLNSMVQHAYYLKHFYTRRSFNHTIGDLTGVYIFSKIFENYKTCNKWEKKFSELLKKQIQLQIRTDGVNIEQSINYHKFVLEFFSLFILINPNLKKENEGRLVKEMCMYLMHTIKPRYKFPLVGDIDDGKVLLLTMKERQKYFDLLNLGASLFEFQELKFITKRLSPITTLLLGSPDKLKQLNSIEPTKKRIYFDKSGYYIARNNWTNKANYIFVDFGQFGPQNAAHSHSDITNIVYCYKGKEIIIDSGTYTYNKSWKDRNYLRGSKAHNIVVIDGYDQAIASNWFGWEDKPRIKRNIKEDASNTYLSCIHDGYRGFLVERIITLNKNIDEIRIQDKIRRIQKNFKKKSHHIDLYFHFAKDLELKQIQSGVEINGELVLTIDSPYPFEMKLEKSIFSPNYGQRYENYRLNVHIEHIIHQQDSIEINTILRPK